MGSVLVGTKDFIAKARRFRKLFGGGMRQTGMLAACAAYSLSHNLPQLVRVHALAKRLQTGLEEIGVNILSRAETCMVRSFHMFIPYMSSPSQHSYKIFYDPSPVGVTYEEIAERGSALPEPLILGGSRLVVHIQTSEEAVEDFLSVVRQLALEKKEAGFVPTESDATGAFKDVYVRRAPKATK